MKLELDALGPILKEKSEATEKLMAQLVVEQGQALQVRTVVEQDEAVAKVHHFFHSANLLFIFIRLLGS